METSHNHSSRINKGGDYSLKMQQMQQDLVQRSKFFCEVAVVEYSRIARHPPSIVSLACLLNGLRMDSYGVRRKRGYTHNQTSSGVNWRRGQHDDETTNGMFSQLLFSLLQLDDGGQASTPISDVNEVKDILWRSFERRQRIEGYRKEAIASSPTCISAESVYNTCKVPETRM
jgi:hypothetical protein